MNPDRIEALAETLADRDWAVLEVPEALPLLRRVAGEAQALAVSGRLRPAATGRAGGRRFAGLRGDSTLWLDDPACGPAAGELLSALDGLRPALNRRLLLGLEAVEAHFARYPPGAGYARHVDRFAGDDTRVLSLVLYLNEDWPEEAGGQLRLHLPAGPVDIGPRLGTMTVFLAGEVEHEVLPATRPRLSVAAWFRRRSLRGA
ncbi:2OG-Fe(II) oxygenase [Arenimonas fontis]|uniref:2OG-Fe(II) oxygenase n=2 Tax=Arenimonas fontis TaxID=2608255 RepID=A0A5B2ZCY8_9GAMM|nr:2OG-Fe(II) oxygenase [Arenimonas fontis]